MRVSGRWVLGLIVAILVTACSPTGSAATPPPAAQAGPTASVGAATAPPSLAASGALATPGSPQASAQSPAPSPAAVATARPTSAPTPRPTATPPPATPLPATPRPAPGAEAVSIAGFAFAPQAITVRVGTRVTWTNLQPAIDHTVTADDGSFGSAPLATGSAFSHVFTLTGTYAYHCRIHTDMTGKVIVTG
jgi:plastocyanin